MSCFNVTDPFLTTLYYVEKRNGILRKNRREGFEKSYVALHGGRGGIKNCQNQPYVINEWPISLSTWTVVFWSPVKTKQNRTWVKGTGIQKPSPYIP